jgi:23S rRNA pseudouridine1911/1915/1917 synthase
VTARRVRFTVDPPGGRLDLVLVTTLGDLSRSRVQQLIHGALVTVDGAIPKKAGLRLEGGERIDVHIPEAEPTSLIPEAIPLDVLFENSDLIVVNKPAGMVVHPSPGHAQGTLVHAALAHSPDMRGIGGELRPGVVHRLDKNTSGIILLAKNDRALQELQTAFKQREVDKRYLALVDGAPPTPDGKVEAPIGRDPARRKRMAVRPSARGRQAESTYTTLRSFPEHTLLEIRPLTGRTHQIRIHLAFIGCPVVGDTVYGRKRPTIPLKRHFLHASRLTITLPGDTRPTTFIAPLPAELEQALEALERRGR